MKAYQITIPGYKAFTYITDTPFAELAAAIRERFGVYPVSVTSLCERNRDTPSEKDLEELKP